MSGVDARCVPFVSCLSPHSIMDDFPYEVGASEKVKIFEAELKTDLAELKAELEESEIVDGVNRVIR